MAKEVTNEDLAIMIAKGFDSVDQRFVKVDARFDGVDARFDQMDIRFEKIEGRLDRVETKLDRALHTDMVNLETRVKKIENHLGFKPAI